MINPVAIARACIDIHILGYGIFSSVLYLTPFESILAKWNKEVIGFWVPFCLAVVPTEALLQQYSYVEWCT